MSCNPQTIRHGIRTGVKPDLLTTHHSDYLYSLNNSDAYGGKLRTALILGRTSIERCLYNLRNNR
ncbi:MAG: hypothetical protein ICV78_22265 [Tolypothrix sp. Co-bin9]|nr:hypothetical protein [Tolypothrix sp. Co-bin9]